MVVCVCRTSEFPLDLKLNATEPNRPATKSLPILKAGHALEKVEMDVLSASPTPVCILDEEENFFN